MQIPSYSVWSSAQFVPTLSLEAITIVWLRNLLSCILGHGIIVLCPFSSLNCPGQASKEFFREACVKFHQKCMFTWNLHIVRLIIADYNLFYFLLCVSLYLLCLSLLPFNLSIDIFWKANKCQAFYKFYIPLNREISILLSSLPSLPSLLASFLLFLTSWFTKYYFQHSDMKSVMNIK